MNGHVPGYWLNETGGELRPAVWAYLRGEQLGPDEISVIRDYLRQWMAGDFVGPAADELREMVEQIGGRQTLREWLEAALEAGIDPL